MEFEYYGHWQFAVWRAKATQLLDSTECGGLVGMHRQLYSAVPPPSKRVANKNRKWGNKAILLITKSRQPKIHRRVLFWRFANAEDGWIIQHQHLHRQPGQSPHSPFLIIRRSRSRLFTLHQFSWESQTTNDQRNPSLGPATFFTGHFPGKLSAGRRNN